MTVTEDRYRWLEDDADPKVIDWQREADAATVAALAASPARAAVEAAVRSTYVDLFTATAPQRFGSRWFRKAVPAGRTDVVFQVSDSPTGPGRILVDPAREAEGATIVVAEPSPDGSLVLIGLNLGGQTSHRLLDAGDGRVVREFPGIVVPGIVAWARDMSGFFHQRMELGTDAAGRPAPAMRIAWQPLDGDSEPIALDFDHPLAWARVSADGRWVAAMASQVAPRPRWVKRFGEKDWTRFLPRATAMYKGIFVGDDYWAITDDVSGWCRLVAIPLASHDDEMSWRELVPARDEVKLASISLCGDRVALATIEGGVMRLTALDTTGQVQGAVPLPGDGAFALFGLGHIMAILGEIVGPDGDGCTFVHSSLTSSPGVYRADLAGRTLATLELPAVVLADRDVRRLTAEGPHGPVDYWVMGKASTPLDATAATIVSGYGGFNVPHIPHYWPMASAWTELGGLWVVAHLRGGGERDTAFWEAGRMHRKQGTFDDLAAVIEDLHARGIGSPKRTGIWGTSNGGLLVGATVAQRPELFRAAVAQVPILDLVNFGRDPMTLSIARADYGDPENPADAAAMRAYSPYHAVRDGTAYPALLCDAGADDTSCPPWHSRKMVAAVAAASASGHRTLLRVREAAGHNQMSVDRFIEREIEELTFFHDELRPGR